MAGYTGGYTEDQAKAAWDAAIPLLIQSGLPDRKARVLFGGLVKKAGHAGALLGAVEAAKRAHTGDAASYLTKAASGVRTEQNDPSLLVSWT